MSLSYNKSGLKKEHIVIMVLVAALIGVIVYMVTLKTSQPAPVAPPLATESVATPAPAQPDILAQQQAMLQQNQPQAPVGFALAVGKYEGEAHPIVNILDGLKGFKYDESVPAADTVYIIYDPRCPYCHALFDKIETIDLKAKQITIKWLPTLALGENETAAKQASLSLRAKTVADFEAGFLTATDTSGVELTQQDRDALNENMAFLFEASDQTFGVDHPKSVPAAFFIDKKTGTPNMMYGASDEAVFKQIFGE